MSLLHAEHQTISPVDPMVTGGLSADLLTGQRLVDAFSQVAAAKHLYREYRDGFLGPEEALEQMQDANIDLRNSLPDTTKELPANTDKFIRDATGRNLEEALAAKDVVLGALGGALIEIKATTPNTQPILVRGEHGVVRRRADQLKKAIVAPKIPQRVRQHRSNQLVLEPATWPAKHATSREGYLAFVVTPTGEPLVEINLLKY
jgi:hypothetical protein